MILVSQTTNHIKQAETVVIMDHGQIKDCGRPNEYIMEEIQELVAEDDDLEKEILEELKNTKEENEENDEEDTLLQTEQTSERKKVYSEIKKEGGVDFQSYLKYVMFGGGFLLIFANLFLFGLTQTTESYSDKLLTRW